MIDIKKGVDTGGVDRRVMLVLRLLTNMVGDFTVTCLRRSEDENAEVGGVTNSLHLVGQAADIWFSDDVIYSRAMGALGSNFGGVQFLYHKNHLHIEIDSNDEDWDGKVWLKE